MEIKPRTSIDYLIKAGGALSVGESKKRKRSNVFFFFPRWFWNGAGINTTFCLILTEIILLGSPFRIGKKRVSCFRLK